MYLQHEENRFSTLSLSLVAKLTEEHQMRYQFRDIKGQQIHYVL